MNQRFLISLLGSLILALLGLGPAFGLSQATLLMQPGSNGKAVALRILADEDDELEVLYAAGEVDAAEYQLTKARHWVLRRYLNSLPDDLIDLPEIHVLTKAEFPRIFRQAPEPARLKVGAVWEEHWNYRGKATRGQTFYIFERHPAER